jgi:hypothetical protein
VFGTPNSHPEDPGLVLGACAIYPDDSPHPTFVCLFVSSSLSPLLHQGKFYNTAFRQQWPPLWSSCLMLCHVCSSKGSSESSRKKVWGVLLLSEAFCACSIHLFPLKKKLSQDNRWNYPHLWNVILIPCLHKFCCHVLIAKLSAKCSSFFCTLIFVFIDLFVLGLTP